VIAVGDPCLAAGDCRVAHLARARDACEGLLTDRVPVDEIDPRDLHRGVHIDETRDEVQRQVLPRGPASGHDQALPFAGDDERAFPPHLHRGISIAQDVAIGPVRRRLVPVEEAGFGEQHGT
jgi:hypothetical protein